MKKLVVLGAGTAGTMIVNRLRPRLGDEWTITIVDQNDTHLYQPGLLFIPFGTYGESDVVRERRSFVPSGVDLVLSSIEGVHTEAQVVALANGQALEYDELIVATGTHATPSETPGLEGPAWRDTVHDFYTLDGALALFDRLERWEGGRLVMSVMELP